MDKRWTVMAAVTLGFGAALPVGATTVILADDGRVVAPAGRGTKVPSKLPAARGRAHQRSAAPSAETGAFGSVAWLSMIGGLGLLGQALRRPRPARSIA